MSIPLVQNNEKDSINTSIIAIKRQIERINALLGLSNSEEIDTSVFATKTELEDAVTQVETDLAPVDEVTADNMQSVTSNAVNAAALNISEYTNITGLNVYKVGKVVFIRLYRAQTSGNEVTLGSLPEGYRPVTIVRGILIKQENITPTGEITILYNGDVKITNIGGSNFNGTYVAEVCFFTRD